MPQPKDRIQPAIRAIGENTPDDYKIAPLKHANQLRAKAPALADLLESARIKAVAEAYHVADQEAVDAQARFKTVSSRARWAVFVAACFTGSLLAVGSLGTVLGASQQSAATLLAVAGLISGVVAGVWLNQIGSGKLLEQWMTKRAEAESHRLRYFSRLSEQSGDPETRLLQLEYFRRFQLDVQRTFYRARGRDHQAAAARAVTMGSWSMGGVALANGLVLQGIEWAGIAALGVAAQALSSLATNGEAANQDTRNSERYERTWQTLQKLTERLDEVRHVTALGNKDALPLFVESVHEQLSLEHRQWLKSGEQISSAIAGLDKTLEESRAGTRD